MRRTVVSEGWSVAEIEERAGAEVGGAPFTGACAAQRREGVKRMAVVRMVSAMRIGF